MNIIASKTRRTQRGSVALSPVQHRAKAIGDMFRLYANDARFRQGLRTLADDLRPVRTILAPLRGHSFAAVEQRASSSPRLAAYLAAIRGFARDWGLDRLGADGFDALHRWLDLAFQDPTETGRSFGFGLSLASDYPGVDTTFCVGGVVDYWDPEDEPRVYSDQAVPDRFRERGAWRKVLNDPMTFRAVEYGDALLYRKTVGAEKRIIALSHPSQAAKLAAELDRIQGEYDALGYEWSDSAGQYERDLKWTFERLALARPVWEIVKNENRKRKAEGDVKDLTEDIVFKAIRHLAQRLGLSGFPKSPRKTEPNPRVKTPN